MKKFFTLLLIVIAACLIAGLYGILHDQLTYTISPEYYTKFKFYQFGLLDKGNEIDIPYPRLQVSIVGFLATFWMGIPIGIILGLTGLVHSDWKVMLRVTLKAFAITILIAFATGLVGLMYGKLYRAEKPRQLIGWFIPGDVIDFKNFIIVGSMHNFSYLGGVTGLIGGVLYSLRQRNKMKPFMLLKHKTPRIG